MIRKSEVILLFFLLFLSLINELPTIEGGGPDIEVVCDNDRSSILASDNTSYRIWIKSYIDVEIVVNLSIEDVPDFWIADLDNNNFILEQGDFINITLNVIPPQNASVGFIAEINVTLSYKINGTQSATWRVQTCTEIIGPELAFSIEGIMCSPKNPKDGENTLITGQIYNIGRTNASNVSVKFFIDNTQIDENQIIERIGVNESIFVSVSWIAREGEHIISVKIDSDGTIDEYDEENNTAVITISVKTGVQDNFSLYFLTSIVIFIAIIALIIFLQKSR